MFALTIGGKSAKIPVSGAPRARHRSLHQRGRGGRRDGGGFSWHTTTSDGYNVINAAFGEQNTIVLSHEYGETMTDAPLACDFFGTVALSGARPCVFAVTGHGTRRIRILSTTAHPTGSRARTRYRAAVDPGNFQPTGTPLRVSLAMPHRPVVRL